MEIFIIRPDDEMTFTNISLHEQTNRSLTNRPQASKTSIVGRYDLNSNQKSYLSENARGSNL